MIIFIYKIINNNYKQHHLSLNLKTPLIYACVNFLSETCNIFVNISLSIQPVYLYNLDG